MTVGVLSQQADNGTLEEEIGEIVVNMTLMSFLQLPLILEHQHVSAAED